MVAEATLPAVTLVLGGARSGKSRFAEGCVMSAPSPHIYLATAEPGDMEMAERIKQHQERRGPDWQTVEEPLGLSGAIERNCRDGAVVLVDCLTLWLSNLMAAGWNVEDSVRQLCLTLDGTDGTIVLVSNEVGQGIVPDNNLARQFRDHAGWMNQEVARVAQSVVLVTAGLPHFLKSHERN